jgi:hypothetical protein
MIVEIVTGVVFLAGALGLLALLWPRDPLRKQKAIAVAQATVWIARVQRVHAQAAAPKTLPVVDTSGHDGPSTSQR